MFDWLKLQKKRLMGRMLGVAAAGRMATGCALLQHFRGQESDESVAIERATAVSNWIFQGNLEPQHVKLFNAEKVATIAECWLLLNPDFQELAVQTARVEAAAQFALNKILMVDPSPVLVWFGENYPKSPQLDSYMALVDKQIRKLPDEAQSSLRNWMKRPAR